MPARHRRGRNEPPPRRRRRTVRDQREDEAPSVDDPALRQEISRVIATAQRALQSTRMLFVTDAVLIGMVFALALVAESTIVALASGALMTCAILGAIFWTIEGEEKVMQTDWQWESGGWWLLDLKLRIREP